MPNIEIIKTKIGLLEIHHKNDYIYSAKFVDDDVTPTQINESLILDVKNYFKGKTTEFASKYKLRGTEFQVKVWKEIAKIPYGMTKTYSEIAAAIGQPKSCRAVANACGQNKIVLFIPCHRIIGKNNIGGFRYDVWRKSWLLEFENTD
jgi:O-6-methylguanine DNA methyltransferase